MPELSERHPIVPGWERVPFRATGPASFWASGKIRVYSTLDQAELPDRSGIGPQWHISIARTGKRPKLFDVRRALRAFNMVGAEEDNHHPGNARHFWLVVDPTHRVDCKCKTDETTVTEGDGYHWSNSLEEGDCRGCEAARLLRRPCPIHRGPLASQAGHK